MPYLSSIVGRVVVTFAAAASLSFSGCGTKSDAPPTVDVSGVVTLNGMPLEGAEVYFMTEQHTGYGRTDSDGRYHLVQGATAGDNRVYITKLEGGASVNPDPDSGMDLEQFQAAAAGAVAGMTLPDLPKQRVPTEYSDPENSKLSMKVPEDGTDSADFRL